jgi:hypothetical protein
MAERDGEVGELWNHIRDLHGKHSELALRMHEAQRGGEGDGAMHDAITEHQGALDEHRKALESHEAALKAHHAKLHEHMQHLDAHKDSMDRLTAAIEKLTSVMEQDVAADRSVAHHMAHEG